jgi:hypothetical protein
MMLNTDESSKFEPEQNNLIDKGFQFTLEMD